ncbi:MAG: GtrA family protein [Limisphaerales bacterium]
MKAIAGMLNSRGGKLFRRYAQFCIVGGSGVVVDMGLIYLLASPGVFGWNLTLSKVLAAEVAIVNNFLWNDAWTFRGCASKGWKPRGARFLKFNLICTAGIVWSVALLNLQVYGWHWNVYFSNFVSIVLVSVWNFWLNAKFGWKAKELGRTTVVG